MTINLQRAMMGAAAGAALVLAATAASAAGPPLNPAPAAVVTQGAYAVDTGNVGNINDRNQFTGAAGFADSLGGHNAGVNISVDTGGLAARASGTEIFGESDQLQGSASLTYLVDLHANNAAAAAQISALLNNSGAIATVSGAYNNSINGVAYSFTTIGTGNDLVDPSLSDGALFACDPNNLFPGGTSGCGGGTFSGVALNFVASTGFTGGSSLDFYSEISILASGGVGNPGNNPNIGGGFSAFMDPQIHFGAGLNPDDFSIVVGGGQIGGGGVPEPSAWALMIAGFGLAGASLRRRKASLA